MTNVDEYGDCLECGEPVCEECDLHKLDCECYDIHYAENERLKEPIGRGEGDNPSGEEPSTKH